MNEEQNNFQIDVQAEQQAMSQALDENNFNPSQLIHVMKDIPLPETVFYTATDSFKSNLITSQSSTQEVGFQIKVDAEEAYLKAEDTEKKLLMMAMGIQELSEGIQPGWLENRNKDDFEERVVVEPVNLIFESRRDRMSLFPKWS
jgi:hypothetical protein